MKKLFSRCTSTIYNSYLYFRWWLVPYYWVGIKAYDFVAGSKTVKSSYYLSKKAALDLFPMLRDDKLAGAIVYYDGKYLNIYFNFSKSGILGVVQRQVPTFLFGVEKILKFFEFVSIFSLTRQGQGQVHVSSANWSAYFLSYQSV